jgi:hypothetical protein
MASYTAIQGCRICGNHDLDTILDLGIQALTGVFPKSTEQQVTVGPIQLVKCRASNESCGLLQMAHSYDLGEMYGDNYGYRSGLNASMVAHLKKKVDKILQTIDITDSPTILDIGSNDGTTLSFYPSDKCRRIGIDPTAQKFRHFYQSDIHVIADFFSKTRFEQSFPGLKARAVTSFSMFYDLEQPMKFAQEVAGILDEQGIWVFEQSYMPLMLERNSFDTACHEHLEYYAFKQIKWMLDRSNLKVIDVEFNDVNGGSFSVTAALNTSSYSVFSGQDELLLQEKFLDSNDPYLQFVDRINAACEDLKRFVKEAKLDGKRVAALGASTKGNVLLQYCGFTQKDLFAVAEVNADKFGCFTPGTLIPIKPDHEVIAEADYLVVLPWHFKDFFVNKYAEHKSKLVFPLPNLQIER